LLLSEYQNLKTKIQNEAGEKIAELGVRYAHANNKVCIGDIIRDHISFIKVEELRVELSDKPGCVYFGPEHTAKGVAFKSGSKRDVYQSNIIKKV